MAEPMLSKMAPAMVQRRVDLAPGAHQAFHASSTGGIPEASTEALWGAGGMQADACAHSSAAVLPALHG